jgi:hypothetical protein
VLGVLQRKFGHQSRHAGQGPCHRDRG